MSKKWKIWQYPIHQASSSSSSIGCHVYNIIITVPNQLNHASIIMKPSMVSISTVQGRPSCSKISDIEARAIWSPHNQMWTGTSYHWESGARAEISSMWWESHGHLSYNVRGNRVQADYTSTHCTPHSLHDFHSFNFQHIGITMKYIKWKGVGKCANIIRYWQIYQSKFSWLIFTRDGKIYVKKVRCV